MNGNHCNGAVEEGFAPLMTTTSEPQLLVHKQSSYHYDYSHSAAASPSAVAKDDNNNNNDSTTTISKTSSLHDGTSDLFVSTFNLVASIVGGGVLSVPFAFQKVGGIVWGILWMSFAALMTHQSCIMLCYCARPEYRGTRLSTSSTTHDKLLSSYGQVGKAAFGPILEVVTSALLFVFLVFVLVAYFVLAKDIWTPIVLDVIHQYSQTNHPLDTTKTTTQQQEDDILWGPSVLLGIVLLMSPCFVQRNLRALRYNCYIGFCSISLLCGSLCYYALVPAATATAVVPNTDNYHSSSSIWTNRDFWLAPPQSLQDVAVAFPIFMLSYLCHFNINPIQKALHQPTPERVQLLLYSSITSCWVLMTCFGVGGYAYVATTTTTSAAIVHGNILLNCEEQQAIEGKLDVWLYIGRLGCGVTIMMAMAIMILPCRDSLLEVLDIAVSRHTFKTKSQNWKTNTTSEESPLLPNGNGTSISTRNGSSNGHPAVAVHPPFSSLSENCMVHYTTTLSIVLVCYIAAVKAPGVAIVWSLCGSSMAFSIAFILPAACYLEMAFYRPQREQQQQQKQSELPIKNGDETTTTKSILPQQQQPQGPSRSFAWAMLILSTLAAIFCTIQTVQSMMT